VKIHYSNKKDESTLEDERLIDRYYKKDESKNIKARLTELRAANCLSEIPECPPPVRHKLNGNYNGHWCVRYSKNDRIIFKPFGTYNINDLNTITEIEIVRLGDYH
jgi:proteic killer suppression protein